MREEAWEPESCDYLRQIVKGFLFVSYLFHLPRKKGSECAKLENILLFSRLEERRIHMFQMISHVSAGWQDLLNKLAACVVDEVSKNRGDKDVHCICKAAWRRGSTVDGDATVLNRERLTSSVPSAAHEDLDSSKQRTLEKLQITARLRKVIQTPVDIDLKMNRCHAELHAALSAVDKLEEGHDLFLFLPTRANETAAALKLVNSVQQSVSDCHSALVVSHDPGDVSNKMPAALCFCFVFLITFPKDPRPLDVSTARRYVRPEA